MATEIKVWQIESGQLEPLETTMAEAGRTEPEHLEQWRLFGISQGKATYSGTPIRRIGDSPQGRDKGVGTEL